MTKRKPAAPGNAAGASRLSAGKSRSSPQARLLKKICIIGLVLAVILSWSLVFLILFRDRDSAEKENPKSNSFAAALKNYDLTDASGQEQIEAQLSRLQKQAGSAEELLSVLKRRRILALADRRFIPGYAKAASEAAAGFSHSAPLAAVAAEAVLMDGTGLSEVTQDLLRTYARNITQSRLEMLELSLNILAGDLENPEQAAGVPRLEDLLSQDLTRIPAETRKSLMIDEFLLRSYKRDIQGAAYTLNALLTQAGQPAGDAGLLRMGADFFYDHGEPLRAAEIFLQLGGNRDLAMAADALFLAGEILGARNIWLALSSSANSSSGNISRIIYNLAATSAETDEERAWLENLFTRQSERERSQSNAQPFDITGIFGTIRYTRLLDTQDSIAILDDANMKQNPLLDLELLRRRLDTLNPTRSAAEVWLLLGRRSRDEAIHEWAAWYFDHQKLYGETEQLLKEAERKGMTGSWAVLHRSLALIREGKTAEGERTLKEAYEKNPADWRIPANLGRIQESRRNINAALDYYEAAAALFKNLPLKTSDKKDAARVQVRISRCLETLGRTTESRRAMEIALELDPENINIRRSLRNPGSL